jgi:hypothetical protein
MTFWILLTILCWVGVPITIFVFARRLLRSLERRTLAQSDLAGLGDRLQKLEEHVEQIALDQDRLAEGQRFTNNLLASRTNDPVP